MYGGNRDSSGHETARTYYVQALTATNAALQDPSSVMDDNTMASVFLLGLFERLNWEGPESLQTWTHHVRGAIRVLQVRGRGSFHSPSSLSLFRDVRQEIITHALWSEIKVPDFVVQWSESFDSNPAQAALDQLSILACRLAGIKDEFRTGTKSDEELAALAATLEADMVEWSRSAGVDSSLFAVSDVPSSAPSATAQHSYAAERSLRYWNQWRSMRILLSRVQEAIVRRSWPVLRGPLPSPSHFRTIRFQMALNVCIAADTVLAAGDLASLPPGSVAVGYSLISSLCLAGTCYLEQLCEPTVRPGSGSQILALDSPVHTDRSSEPSTRLASVVRKLEHISDSIGVQWAGVIAQSLTGERRLYYDVGGSQIVRSSNHEVAAVLTEQLDLSSSDDN